MITLSLTTMMNATKHTDICAMRLRKLLGSPLAIIKKDSLLFFASHQKQLSLPPNEKNSNYGFISRNTQPHFATIRR